MSDILLNDLTSGKPGRIIWRFSIPLLLSTAIQQLYNIAGSIIVGRFVGSEALASIGAAYPITLFYIAVATGSSMGCSVVISQLFGAKKLRDMKSAIFTAIISLSSLGVILAVLGVTLSGPLMRLLNAPDAVYDNARAYLAIYSAGVIPMFVYNAVIAIFTGLGNSKRPLFFLILSSVMNIILSLIAVRLLGLGVVGAAWATCLSLLAAAGLSALTLIRQLRGLYPEEKVPVFDVSLLKSMSRIAIPSILQQSCVALAHTVVQSIVNTFPTAVIAGYEAASKIHNFAYMSFNTLGIALSSFAAQNFGAGKIPRIRKGFRDSTLICLGLTAAVVLIMQIIPARLIGLFTDSDTDAAVVRTGVTFLRIISPDYFIICFIITIGGLLRGIGRIREFFIVTVVDFTVRVAMCFILTDLLQSYTGLLWSWYFGSAVDVILCFIIYSRISRKGELRVFNPQG